MNITVPVRVDRVKVLGCKQTLSQVRDLVAPNYQGGEFTWKYLKFRVQTKGVGANGLAWVSVKVFEMFEVQTDEGQPHFIIWGWVGNHKVLVNYSPDWVRFESEIVDSRWRN